MLCRITALTSGGIDEPCAGQFGDPKDQGRTVSEELIFFKKRYVELCDLHAGFLR